MRKDKKGSERAAVPPKRGEEALKGTDRLLQTLLDHTHMLVAYLDPKFNFVRVNRAYARADERDPSFYPGKNHFDLYPDAQNEEIFRNVVQTGQPHFAYAKAFEYVEHPERGVSYWDWSLTPIKGPTGAVTGLVLTLVNVTERKLAEEALRKAHHELEIRVQERTRELSATNIELKAEISERRQAEERLRESEQKYKTLVETSRDMIFTVDLTGDFLFTNQAFGKILGYSAEEVERLNGLELIHPEDSKTVKEQFARLLEGETVDNMEYRYRRKDGSYINILNNAAPVFDSDGNVVAAFGVARDITRRKQAEEQLSEYRNHLEELVEKRTAEIKKANEQLQKEIAERKQAEEGLEWELAVNRELARLSGALITGASSIPDIANIVLDSARSLTQSEHGYVSSVDPKTRDTVAYTLTKMMGNQCQVRGEDRRIRFPVGADGLYPSLWGHSLNSREDFFTNAPGRHEASRGVPEGHIPLKNFLSVPAIIGKELVGQIALANSDRAYTDRHLDAVRRLAELYAMAIQRKRAEEKIKQQNQFLNNVIESLTHPFFVLDAEDYRIRAANSAALQDGRLDNSTCYSINHRRNTPCDGGDHPCPLAEVRRTKKPVVVEHVHYDEKGNARIVEVHGYPIFDPQGNVIQMIEYCLDVTQRRRAEEALRESEEKFRGLAEQSPNMIFINRKGRVVYANRRCEEIMGYKREEFYSPDFDFFEMVAPESRDLVKENFDKHGRGEQVRPYEYTLCAKDGKCIESILNSELIMYGGEPAILGIVTDITERKHVEEELRKRTYDLGERVKELNCLYLISNLVEKPGISLEEILRGATNLIPTAWQYPEITCARVILEDKVFLTSNFKETVWNQLTDIVVHGNPVGSVEVCYLEERPEKDEGPFLAEERSLLKAVAERLGRVVERTQAREEIQKLNESLKAQAKELAAANKELEAFSYSASHDLRAPLRTIEGFSRALLEDYADKVDQTGKDYLQRVRSATQRMGQLIDDLLNLSLTMRREMRREETNLSELARTIAGELQKTKPQRRVDFLIQDRVLAQGDARLLRELLENLLGNAWKFTGKNPQARIEFGAEAQGDRRVHFVRDNGAGFDMNYADKLFVPFQRLHSDSEFSGNGIGLALVSRIVNRHGGRIWAEGEVEKGATFYFTLE